MAPEPRSPEVVGELFRHPDRKFFLGLAVLRRGRLRTRSIGRDQVAYQGRGFSCAACILA